MNHGIRTALLDCNIRVYLRSTLEISIWIIKPVSSTGSRRKNMKHFNWRKCRNLEDFKLYSHISSLCKQDGPKNAKTIFWPNTQNSLLCKSRRSDLSLSASSKNRPACYSCRSARQTNFYPPSLPSIHPFNTLLSTFQVWTFPRSCLASVTFGPSAGVSAWKPVIWSGLFSLTSVSLASADGQH